MSFCLDDGVELLYGPASGDEPVTAISSVPLAVASDFSRSTREAEPKTAILQPPVTGGGPDSPARLHTSVDKLLVIVPIVLAILALGAFLGFRYFASSNTEQIRLDCGDAVRER